jgi:hypothetical protein
MNALMSKMDVFLNMATGFYSEALFLNSKIKFRWREKLNISNSRSLCKRDHFSSLSSIISHPGYKKKQTIVFNKNKTGDHVHKLKEWGIETVALTSLTPLSEQRNIMNRNIIEQKFVFIPV